MFEEGIGVSPIFFCVGGGMKIPNPCFLDSKMTM